MFLQSSIYTGTNFEQKKVINTMFENSLGNFLKTLFFYQIESLGAHVQTAGRCFLPKIMIFWQSLSSKIKMQFDLAFTVSSNNRAIVFLFQYFFKEDLAR